MDSVEPDSGGEEARAGDKIMKAGVRMGELAKQIIAAAVVLVIFGVMAFLTLQGQLGDDVLIFFAGVILGYVLELVTDLV